MHEKNKLEFLGGLSQAGDQANMWQTGQAMGLNRDASEALAMDLMSQGLLEIVNLSGKVRLTEAGRRALGPASGPGDGLEALVRDLEAAGDLGLKGASAQDLAADLATLRAQLGRSRPLMPVVKACLAALESLLGRSSASEAADLAKRAAALRE